MRPRGAAARSQARIFRRDGGAKEEGGRGGEKRPMGRRRVKIVTVAGHLTLRGRRIRARPRSNKWRRSPKPMSCLSVDNGDQFCAEKIGEKERCRSRVLAGEGVACSSRRSRRERGWKRRVRAGTLVLIGQSLSGRVLQSRPRSSTSSSSSSAPFPLPPPPPPPPPPSSPPFGQAVDLRWV